MAVKFANNVSTTLSAAINATQTTISVADASGLPTLSSGDYIYLTIDTDTNSPTIEVVKVTGVSTNTLTVVRGQDGTTASSFSSGTKVELRVTAAGLDDISAQAQSAADTESVSIDGDTMTGGLTVDLSTDSAFVTFERSGSEVGKIVHESGTSRLTMGTGNSGLTFIDTSQDRIVPRKSGGGNANASIDLGDGASQWREIYLSGGLRVNSQLVIDSSRNIANVANITGTGNLSLDASGGGEALLRVTGLNEGRLQISNQSNWGLIAKGVANSPEIGMYHSGQLRFVGFADSEGNALQTSAGSNGVFMNIHAGDGKIYQYLPLSVVGSITATASGAVASFNRTDNDAIIELKRSGSVKGYIGANTSGDIKFYNSSAAGTLTISSAGNLGTTGTISSGAITSSASVIASGNSNSFGNTTISNLTVTTVTASGSITASGNSNSFGNTTVGSLASGAITASALIKGTRSATSAHVDYLQFHMPSWSGHTGYLKNLVWNDGTGNIGAIGAEYDGSKTNIHFHSQYNQGYESPADKTFSVYADGNVNILKDLKINGTTRIAQNGNATLGTISSGAITSSGNISGAALIIDSATAVDKSGNYMVFYDGSGAPALYAGNTADNRNYYQSNHHRFRSDDSNTIFAELSSAGLRIGGASTPAEKLHVESGNIRVDGAYLVNGTTVIDSSLNLTNIGTISSGSITTSGTINGSVNQNSSYVHKLTNTNTGTSAYTEFTVESGSQELRIGTAQNYSSTQWDGSWVYAASGELFLKSGASHVKIYAGDTVNPKWSFNSDGSIRQGNSNGSTFVDSSRNITAGTISSGAITSSGDIDAAGDIQFTSQNHEWSAGASGSGNNILGKVGNAGAAGIVLKDVNNVFRVQLYGDGTNYGFLNAEWASWDFKKEIGGSLYLNNNTNYNLRPDGTTNLNNLNVVGNLTVSGTTTTIDTANLNVEDNNITLNYSTGDSSATANGAGITIQDAVNSTTDASMTWNATSDVFQFSHGATFGTGTIDPDSFGGTSGGFGHIVDGSGWGARGLYIHGGATGDAAAIGHNGSNLYFGIQNGSSANSMDTWLTVNPTKVANFAAQVNVSGHGNSGQWNTAYGWGNHASAGYLTAEADTLATVTGRGATTTNAISTGAITSSGKISASDDFETATRLKFTNNIANGWSAPIIFRENAHLALSDYSGVKLGGYNGTSYGPRVHVAGNGNLNILEGNLMMAGTTVIDSSRNITGASAHFTSTYGGGTGDYTDVTTPPLKLETASGYIRFPHISAHSGISIVHNYESGKNVYWGESGDTGTYYFRGRDLRVESANLMMGSYTVIDSNRNLTNINTATISGSTSVLLTLNPTANNYGGIAFQYGGVTKGFSIYNSGAMIYGGESGIPTYLQAGGQHGLAIRASDRNVSIGSTSSFPQKLYVNGNIRSDGAYYVGGLAVIDSSRNLTNIAKYNVSSSSYFVGNTNYGYRFNNAADTLNLVILDDSGNLDVIHGALKMGNATVIDASRNLTNIGTISSGAITASSIITGSGATGSVIGGVRAYGSSSAYMGASDGAGRTAFFGVDSSGYAMFGALTNHDAVIRANNSVRLRVKASGNVNIHVGGLEIGDTLAIDSSRNLTNIGTYTGAGDVVAQAANVLFHARSSADNQTVGFRAGYQNHGTLQAFFRYTTGDAQLYIDNDFTGNNGVYSNINFRNKANNGTSLVNRLTIHGSTGNVNITGGTLQMSGTTVIDSSRVVQNVTLGHSNTGARFETNDWMYDTGGKARFYFEGGGRTFFGSDNGYVYRDNSDTGRATISNYGGINLLSGGDGQVGSTVALAVGGTTTIDSSRNVFGVNGSFTGYAAIGSRVGTISPSLSVDGATNSVPFLAKSGNYSTVFSVLPWSNAITYLASGTYYQGGSWVHASPNDYECLLGISGLTGGRWYVTSNGLGGSWNHASDVQLWDNDGVWTSNVSTSGTITAGSGSSSTGYYVGTTQIVQGSTRNLVNIGTITAGLTKLTPSGYSTAPQGHAALNIGRAGSGETRAIDIWGSWTNGESKSITFNHGSSLTHIVGQINCAHSPSTNTGGSSFRWGKLYHGGDSSQYVMELHSENTSLGYLNINRDMVQIGQDSTYTGTYATIGFGGRTNGYNRIFGRTSTADGLFLASATGHGIYMRPNGGDVTKLTVAAGGQVEIDQGDIILNQDGTYGATYGTIGFGGYGNGSNRVFGNTGTADGLYLASATGRDVHIRTNGSSANTFRFTAAGELQMGSGNTTVIDASRNITAGAGGFSGLLSNSAGAKLEIQGAVDGGSSRGIYMWDTSDTNWGIYMAQAGAGKSLAGGTAPTSLDGRSAHAVRFRCYGGDATRAWIFENHNEQARVSFTTDSGNISATGNITAYASDARLKENVTTITGALDKVKQLRGVEFDWKDECKSLGFIPSVKHETGVIAQEVEAVIPDAVVPAPFNNDFLTVHKDKIVPLLIEAIKEQQDQIDELKALIEEMKNGNN